MQFLTCYVDSQIILLQNLILLRIHFYDLADLINIPCFVSESNLNYFLNSQGGYFTTTFSLPQIINKLCCPEAEYYLMIKDLMSVNSKAGDKSDVPGLI